MRRWGFVTGFAVGGVLFGEGDRHLVRLLAARPIACDYSVGSSFTLSEADDEKLAALLRKSVDDPDLKYLVPVGWYHSHTRSGLALTPSDIALDKRHFGSQTHIAVLLRPDEGRPTSAGIFVESDSGEISNEPALVIEELPGSKPIESPEPAAPLSQEVKSLPVQASAAEPDLPGPPLFASFGTDPVSNGKYRSRDWKAMVAGLLILAAVIWAAGRWLAPPEYWEAMREYRTWAGRYVGTVVGYWRQVGLPASVTGVSLRALASGPNLVIVRWDSTSGLLAHATGGMLEIQDGPRQVREALDMVELVNGSHSHRRVSDDVRVRLTLFRKNAEPYSESTRFLDAGTIVEGLEPETETASRETLQAEIERLRVAVLRQQDESQTFENTLEAIRKIGGSPETAVPAPRAAGQAAAPSRRPAVPPPTPKPVLQQKPAVTLRQSPPAQPPSALKATSPLSGPSMGRLTWTGFLPEGQALTIQDGDATIGSVSGRLPGVPVRVTVYPGELTEAGLSVFSSQNQHAGTVTEPPGVQNSWIATTYRYDPSRAQAAAVVEPPAERNNWSRIVIRAAGQPLSVVVIDWRRSN